LFSDLFHLNVRDVKLKIVLYLQTSKPESPQTSGSEGTPQPSAFSIMQMINNIRSNPAPNTTAERY